MFLGRERREPARYAHEYEYTTGNGYVRIYAGHPGYCQNEALHSMHDFHYEFMLRDGTPVRGSYLCYGEGGETLPSRLVDLPAVNGPD